MNEVMVALIQYIVAYVGVSGLIFFLLNFLTKGFLFTYLKVKSSQGKKILVEVSSATDDYHRAGRWEDGFFKFKNRGKEEKAIPIDEPVFKRLITHSMGVGKVFVDEVGNTFLTKDFEAVKFTVDSGRLNTTLIRIKNRPVPKSKQENIIIILLVITLLVAVFLFFRVMLVQEAVEALGSLTGNI